MDTWFCISYGAFGRMAPVLNGEVDSEPEVFFLCSHAEWRSVLGRCFSFQSGCTARTWKTGHYFFELHVAETRDDGQHFFAAQCGIFRPPPRS